MLHERIFTTGETSHSNTDDKDTYLGKRFKNRNANYYFGIYWGFSRKFGERYVEIVLFVSGALQIPEGRYLAFFNRGVASLIHLGVHTALLAGEAITPGIDSLTSKTTS